MRKKLQILMIYFASAGCLYLYYFLVNSEGVQEFLEMAQRGPTDTEFMVITIATIIGYALPIAGISGIAITTGMLIKKALADKQIG